MHEQNLSDEVVSVILQMFLHLLLTTCSVSQQIQRNVSELQQSQREIFATVTITDTM